MVAKVINGPNFICRNKVLPETEPHTKATCIFEVIEQQFCKHIQYSKQIDGVWMVELAFIQTLLK